MKQKRIIKSMLLAFSLVIFTGELRAQQPKALSLKDALNYALENFADARKANLDVENATYQIDEVRSRALPQISGSGGLTYNPLLQQSVLPGEFNMQNPGTPMLVAFGQKWGANIGVSVNQALFDKSVFTGLKAAKTAKEFYALNKQLTEEQVIEQVANSYYQVMVQRQQIDNVDSNLSVTQKTRNVIAGLYESGLGKQIDVDRIDVKIANLTSQRQQLLNAVSLYENQLKFFIGMPIETAIVLPAQEKINIENHLELTDTSNTDSRIQIQTLKKQGELLNLNKESIKAEYYPSLSLSSSYSYQGVSNQFPIFKGAKGGANWFDVASVGLNLKIPIFNGNATKSRINQADIEIKKLNEDINKTKLSLDLDYKNAVTELNNTLIILNTQKRNEQLAQKVLSYTQNNYTQGLATLTDLLDAQTSLSEAQNNNTAAILSYRLAEIKLIKSKGQLKTLTQ